ncbi:MAG: ABC transporter permease [Acidimicrobiales bacterium]
MTAVPADGLPPLIEHGSVPRSFTRRALDVWDYRELLGNLVRRELKVRYKDSVLGFLWTLLNPLLYLAVFSVVFDLVLNAGAPRYGLLLLSGLLVWNLFATGLASATASIVGNGPLVQKVWFPREILPIAAVGASFISFCFQMIVLLVGLAAFGHVPEWSMMWLLIPALLLTLLLAIGLGLLLSAYNVYYRDTNHFLELGLLAWFWFTCIVYPFQFVADALGDNTILAGLNPMMGPVVVFKRVLYNPNNLSPAAQEKDFAFLMDQGVGFYVQMLGISFGFALVLLVMGMRSFARLEGDFGEVI